MSGARYRDRGKVAVGPDTPANIPDRSRATWFIRRAKDTSRTKAERHLERILRNRDIPFKAQYDAVIRYSNRRVLGAGFTIALLERLGLPGAELNPPPEESPIRRWQQNGAFDLDSEWWGSTREPRCGDKGEQPNPRREPVRVMSAAGMKPPARVLRRRPSAELATSGNQTPRKPAE